MIGRKAWMILLAGALMTGALPVVLSGDVIDTQTAGGSVEAEAESLYGGNITVHMLSVKLGEARYETNLHDITAGKTSAARPLAPFSRPVFLPPQAPP